MTRPIAPGLAELQQAYSQPNPALAGTSRAEAVVSGPEGITVLCTANANGSGEHTILLRLALDGNLRWKREYPISQGAGRAMVRLPDASFVIAGDVQRSPMVFQGHLLHLAASGDPLAAAAFGPLGATGFVALAALPDSSAVAGGTASWQGWLLRADTALNPLWDQQLAGTGDVYAIASLPTGGFAVAATTEASTSSLGRTSLTLRSDDGTTRTEHKLPASGLGELASLAALPDGSLLAAGHHTAGDNDPAQLWALKLEPTGSPIWERFLGPINQTHRGRAIALTPDGGALLASDALNNGHRQATVTRLAPTGATLWEHSCTESEEETVARSITSTESGGAILVGSSTKVGGKSTVWILCLDQNGQTLWKASNITA